MDSHDEGCIVEPYLVKAKVRHDLVLDDQAAAMKGLVLTRYYHYRYCVASIETQDGREKRYIAQ